MKRAWIAAAALVLTACSGGDSEDTARAEVGTEEAAEKVAQAQLDDFSDGDYAEAWERFTGDGQSQVPEDDYVAISKACALTDFDADVTSVRVSGDNAVVHYDYDGEDRTAQLKLEDDDWRWVLSDGTVEAYSRGVDEAIAYLVNLDAC